MRCWRTNSYGRNRNVWSYYRSCVVYDFYMRCNFNVWVGGFMDEDLKKALRTLLDNVQNNDYSLYFVVMDAWAPELEIKERRQVQRIKNRLVDFFTGFNVSVELRDSYNDKWFSRKLIKSVTMGIDNDGDFSMYIDGQNLSLVYAELKAYIGG